MEQKDRAILLNMNRRNFLALVSSAVLLTVNDPVRSQSAPTTAQTNTANPAPVGNISSENFALARQRAAEIVSRMTLNDKIGQLGITPMAAPSVGLKAYPMANHEALHGITHPGPATSFPVPLALANAWNPELVRDIYNAVSDEARAGYKKYAGALVFHSPPTLNMAQDLCWGRVEEALGEDPLLASRLAVQIIRAMQGTDDKYLKTIPCAKHFICNGTEKDRTTVSADPDSRSLREYYLPPFHAAVVEAGCFSVMAAYNSLDGVPCAANKILLTDILRTEWGFQGFVVSDRRGVIGLNTFHHYRKTFPDAAAAAMQAGLDVDGWNVYQKYLAQALKQNLVTEAQIDRAVIHLYTGLVLLGIVDPPQNSIYDAIPQTVLDSQEHRALALEAARQSLVLLKNQNHFLPLDMDKIKTIALIGPTAATCELGGYSGRPMVQISVLNGIAAAMGIDSSGVKPKSNSADLAGPNGRKLLYRQGCTTAVVKNSKNSTALFQAALDAAGIADIAIFVAGADGSIDGEGRDRSSLALPGLQHQLIQEVYKANPKTVLVINSNAPVAVNWEQDNLPAILSALCAGQAQGTAITDVLTGDFNPSGKLATTWYRSETDLPDYHDYDIKKGRTYMYFQKDPLYPFGFGLSYTTFEYSDLELDSDLFGPNKPLTISLTVTNTGSSDGTEIVQLYITAPPWPVKQPGQQLVDFQRVNIKAGQSTRVKLTLGADALALRYWDEHQSKFVAFGGTMQIWVGASAADIKLKSQVKSQLA
jgi:beta-glucosidase